MRTIMLGLLFSISSMLCIAEARTIQVRQMGRIADTVRVLAQSGDTVLCDSGLYLGFQVTRQFDSLNPVVIKSKVLHGAEVIGGAKVDLYGCRGIVLDGFCIHGPNISSNSGLIQVSNWASHVTIKNCHVYNAPADADCIKVNQANNVDVLYCDLHDPGLRTDNTAQETLDYVDCNGGLVKGNLFRWVTQHARQYFNAKHASRDYIIEDNVFLNHIGDVGDAAVQLGGSSGTGIEYEGYNQTARNNIFITCETGAIQVRNVNGAYIYNNLFYNCTVQSIILGVLSYGTGSNGGSTNIEVFNNIFYNSNGDMPRVLTAAGTFDNFSHGNNLYYNAGIRILNGLYNPALETGAVVADPGISLTVAANYATVVLSCAILPTGPAVNAGVVPLATSPGVPFDIQGHLRPQGSAYDIGPIEVQQIKTEVVLHHSDEVAIEALPNPFNPVVAILVNGAHAQAMWISIFNAAGAQVADLTNALRDGQAIWDASGLPSGNYLIRAVFENGVANKVVSLVK